MFNHYTRVLSTVPRWSIFPTLRRQYVAEHCFYVSLYTAEIIETYFDEWAPELKYAALRYSLVHDISEARMSDIPGPVKRMIRDTDKYERTEKGVVRMLGYEEWASWPLARRIVKLADQIDEYFFVSTEVAMGNMLANNLLTQVTKRLEAAAHLALGSRLAEDLIEEVQNQVTLMVTFEAVENNDDLMPPAVITDTALEGIHR